jgi:hypothetical protein
MDETTSKPISETTVPNRSEKLVDYYAGVHGSDIESAYNAGLTYGISSTLLAATLGLILATLILRKD